MAEIHTLLGVSTIAPLDVMKKAYRATAKKLHPDHGGSTEQFQKLSALWAEYLRGATPGSGMQPFAGHSHQQQPGPPWNANGSFTNETGPMYNRQGRRYTYTKKDHL